MRKFLLPLAYASTLFLSALLLFWIQPLVAKMLLPVLGGAPAVWNTCLLFFQTLLLAGYSYAMLSARFLGLRAQIILHLALLTAAGLLLPVTISDTALASLAPDSSPILWLLSVLLATLGLPVFVVSASAPLLQRWFSQTRHIAARDPYFLYAASNAGSLLALLFFPFLFEPTLNTTRQAMLWAGGYAALLTLVAWCGFAAWSAQRGAATSALAPTENITTGRTLSRLGWTERLRWLALAFVPSSLVLGVTTFVTIDIAAVPLLWTLPLALYLLTFVLAYARRKFLSLTLLARIAAGAAVLATLVLLSGATEPVWFLTLVHLAFFFFAALTLHTRLADSRPAPAHLAEYYLWIAAGGALGGAFNALLAPIVFTRIIEYPLAIILACLLLPAVKNNDGTSSADNMTANAPLRSDLVWAAALGLLTAGLALVVSRSGLGTLERIAIALGVPLLILNHQAAARPTRLAAGLLAVMLGGSLLALGAGHTLHAERSFYGTLRITRDDETGAHKLYHGSTLHGRQFTDDARRCEPLSYYHRDGPLGDVFRSFDAGGAEHSRVAIVGLGTGATAAYSRDGQTWTFYELDPAVARLARDERFFAYLSRCSAAPANVVLGDARLRLRAADDGAYNLIVLDAFSSDAVPIHLLTREALALYMSKLAPDGWLAMHVSNRSLDLREIVARLAADAGLQAFYLNDARHDSRGGREPSQWIIAARPAVDLSAFAASGRWKKLSTSERAPLWSDDFSSIVPVFKLF